VRQVSDGSAIVYAPRSLAWEKPSISSKKNGIAASRYHGQMESRARREKPGKVDGRRSAHPGGHHGPSAWASTSPPCAPSFILALPKSVEQYYQEQAAPAVTAPPADASFWQKKKIPATMPSFTEKIQDYGEKRAALEALSRSPNSS